MFFCCRATDRSTADLAAIKNRLPEFTIAGYLAGINAWAAGNHANARHYWSETISGGCFAFPDDTSIPHNPKQGVCRRGFSKAIIVDRSPAQDG